MKKIILGLSAFLSSVAMADIHVVGNLSSKDKDTIVMIYADYEYLGTSKACMTTHFPEGEIKFYPLSSQRLINLGESSLDEVIPSQVNVGLLGCKLTLNEDAISVVVGKKQILQNILDRKGKKIGKNHYQFKGSVRGTGIDKEVTVETNKLNCEYEDKDLTTACDVDSVSLNEDGNLVLDIKLK